MASEEGDGAMSLSARVEHLRSATNETFITCSNVYAFESPASQSGGKGRKRSAAGAEAAVRRHHANSLTLVANQLELAALLAIRGHSDAGEDAGDVLISLASLLGIEGSASAPTKMRAAAALYRGAPYVASKGAGAAGADGRSYNLRRYHELFLRTGIAVSALSLGSASAAARLFCDSAGDWQNLLTDVVELRAAGGGGGAGPDGRAGGGPGDEDDDEEFDERVWAAMELEVHSLLCTVEVCVAACVVVGYECGGGPAAGIDVALRIAEKFGGPAREGGGGSGFAAPAHVRVHALYLLSRARMAMAQAKNGHRSLKQKRALLKGALASAVDCHAAAPAEPGYVYHCALYHCLLRQFGDAGAGAGEHALALARRAVELTRGRSAACWMLLALLLTSLSCGGIALDAVDRALGLGWAPRAGAGGSFEHVRLLMVKAAILADSYGDAAGARTGGGAPAAGAANKRESLQLLIEALSALKHVAPERADPDGAEGRAGALLHARRDELISRAWEQMGTVYLTAGEESERYSECIQQAEASCDGYKPSLSADAVQLLRSLRPAAPPGGGDAAGAPAGRLHSSNGSVALASALLYDALDEDLTDEGAYSALAMLKAGMGDEDGGGRALMAAARLEGSRPALSFAILPRTPFE